MNYEEIIAKFCRIFNYATDGTLRLIYCEIDSTDPYLEACWKETLISQEIEPFGFSRNKILYSSEYFRTSNHEIKNYLFCALKNENVIGIFSYSIEFKKDTRKIIKIFNFTFPLNRRSLNIFDQNSFFQAWIKTLTSEFFLNLIHTSPIECPEESDFGNFIQNNNQFQKHFTYLGFRQNYSVDLRKSEFEIFANIRKSYKSLVNKQTRSHELKIMNSNNFSFDEWLRFKDLHFYVSGRQTRNQKTWNIQAEELASGNAYLVYALQNGKMIGGTYVIKSGSQAYYGVGAYIRNNPNLMCSHALQYLAILEAKNAGLITYIIGNACVENNYLLYSEKEKSIANFKRGYADGYFFSLVYTFDKSK